MGERWQERFEALGLMVVTVVVTMVVGGFLAQYGQQRSVDAYGVRETDVVDALRAAAGQASPLAAGLVFLAFLLVALGPGDGFGRLGRPALWAIDLVGALVGVLAAWRVLDVLVGSGPSPALGSVTDPDVASRLGLAMPAAAAAGLALYVAWCAWATIGGLGSGLGDDESGLGEADPLAPEPEPLADA